MYKEKFRDIKNYGGLYQISNAGRVKSLRRKVKHQGGYRIVKEKILKSNFIGSKNRKRYLAISLYKNGKMKTYKIHQLVMNVFKPNPNPKIYTEIDHIRSGDTTCNFVTSLEWVTHSENIKRSFQRDGKKISEETKEKMKKSLINRSDLSTSVLMLDFKTKKVLQEFPSQGEASRLIKISQGNISKCCSGKQKFAGKYKNKKITWRFKNKNKLNNKKIKIC